MSFGAILEVAIGVVFIYLLLGLFVSALHELLAALLRSRGKYLWEALAGLLGGSGSTLFQFVLSHPIVAPSKDGAAASPAVDNPKKTPSYIPARNFSLAVLDFLRGGKASATGEEIERTLNGLPDGPVKTSLVALYAEAGGQLDQFKQRIDTWFDDAMDRLTGVYKRRTQWFSFWLGAIAAILFNVDSISVTRTLWFDPNMRAAMTAAAEKYVQGTPALPAPSDPKSVEEAKKQVDAVRAQIEQLPLPLGWKDPPEKAKMAAADWDKLYWWDRLWLWLGQVWAALPGSWLGWLITAIAVSLGAPFWFDTLKLLINIRGAGPKPDRSPAARAGGPLPDGGVDFPGGAFLAAVPKGRQAPEVSPWGGHAGNAWPPMPPSRGNDVVARGDLCQCS